MSCRPAPACRTLLQELTAKYPNRSRASDGTCGDKRHRQLKSDHNPNSAGLATGVDFTHDPAHGVDAHWLADDLASRRDPRIKYIISQRRIWYPSRGWLPYLLPNPHTTHTHVSVREEYQYDTSPWWPAINPTKEQVLTMVNGVVAVGLIPGQKDHGYVATADGGVYPFGNAQAYTDKEGKTNAYGRIVSSIVDIVASTAGYTLIEANGGTFGFGDGPAIPSLYGKVRYG